MSGGIAASFRLQVHCANCLDRTSYQLDVPQAEDAPTTEDELLESAFLQSQKFVCRKCEYTIGTLVALSKVRECEAA